MSERRLSPELQAFYERMETYIWDHPEDPERAIAAFPGWEADPARVGIYGRFVRSYAKEVIEILFSEVRAVVVARCSKERWTTLVRDYYGTRPGVHHDINGNGRGFPAFIAAQPELPAWLPNLALHEWTRYCVSADPTPIPDVVDALTANPTLDVLQLTWGISPWARDWGGGCEVPAEGPEPGEELSLLWRDPKTGFARYAAASPRTLLVLKMAAEGIAAETAAEAGGVELARVEETIAQCTGWGLVLAPEAITP